MLLPLFEATHSGDETLHISFGSEISDASWGGYFGTLQVALRERVFSGSPFAKCIFDFQSVEWVDPVPLLSLAITLCEFEDLEGQIEMVLSDPRDGSYGGSKPRSHWRMMKYLSREGFIELLCSRKVSGFGEHDDCKGLRKPSDPKIRTISLIDSRGKVRSIVSLQGLDELSVELSELKVDLAYERSRCVPALLMRLNKASSNDGEEVDRWVADALVPTLSSVTESLLDQDARAIVELKVRILLRELVDNISEHAYAGAGYGAIYIRFREGRLGNSSTLWHRASSVAVREKDKTKSPLLILQWYDGLFGEHRPGFFEAYVVDSGKGLVHSLGSTYRELAGSKINKIMAQTFINGKTSKPNRLVAKTGLQQIYDTLNQTTDYLRAYDANEWWAGEFPIGGSELTGFTTNRTRTMPAGTQGASIPPVAGLVWNIRLSWLESSDFTERDKIWLKLDRKEVSRQKFEDIYADGNSDESCGLSIIRDDRFISFRDIGTESTGRIPSGSKHSHSAVVLPPRGISKGQFFRWIKTIVDSLEPQVTTLLVADLVPSDAPLYFGALVNSRLVASGPTGRRLQIYLITTNLRCTGLSIEKGFARANAGLSAKLVYDTRGDGLSLRILLMSLRKFDSEQFWKRVESLESGVLNKEVRWNDAISLGQFLNFPLVMEDADARQILEGALGRISGLYEGEKIGLSPLDIFTYSLISRYRALNQASLVTAPQDLNDRHKLIQIGSIIVTGKQAEPRLRNDATQFHFLVHPQSEHSHQLSLLYWKDCDSVKSQEKEKKEEHPTYWRIGRSGAIALGGWKAFELPRYRNGDESIYASNPKSTYKSMQDPTVPLLKLGHWSSPRHHDLLTVNTLLAYRTSLAYQESRGSIGLALFVLSNLIRGLGIQKRQLTSTGASVLDRTRNALPNHRFPSSLSRNSPILVYPSHATTDYVVSELLSLIRPEFRQTAKERVFAILPLRRERGALGMQISGLTFEALRHSAQKFGTEAAIYFDDAINSSRTLSETKSLLRSVGIQRVSTLTFIDRQRLPSSSHIDGKRHLCYWRVDIPTIGTHGTCPICDALGAATNISGFLLQSVLRNRIKVWQRRWRAMDPISSWASNGIRPIPFQPYRDVRRFGIQAKGQLSGPVNFVQPGGDSNRIRLTSSVGLAMWMTELQAITSRDDLYKKVEREQFESGEEFPSKVRIELLSVQLITFRTESDHETQIMVARELAGILIESTDSNDHTMLAAIALLAMPKRGLREIVPALLERLEVEQLNVAAMNVDALVFLGYSATAMREDLKANIPSAIDTHIRRRRNRVDFYFLLQKITRDTLGRAHVEPMPALISTGLTGPISVANIQAILGSAEVLIYTLEEIDLNWCRHEVHTNEVQDLRNQMLLAKESASKVVAECGRLVRDARSSSEDADGYRLAELVKLCLESAGEIHSRLLFPLGLSDLRRGEICSFDSMFLTEILPEARSRVNDENLGSSSTLMSFHRPSKSKYKQRAEVLKDNQYEAFVPWDGPVRQVVIDTITNVRHVQLDQGLIADPWAKHDNREANRGEAAAWFSITSNSVALEISMINLAGSEHRDGLGGLEDENRNPQLRQLQQVHGGISVDISEVSGNVGLLRAHIKITLPFVHSANLRET